MKLQALIENPELPTIPESIITLNSMVVNDAPLNDIAHVISSDAALTARTLEIANSAWYKRERKIAHVGEAMMLLGTNTVYRLIFASSVIRVFNGIRSDLVDNVLFWKQSLLMACSAQSLSKQLSQIESDLSFTSGILSYIGKLLYYQAEPILARRVLEKCKQQSIPQHQVELEILGFHHAEIGATLLRSWNLPEVHSESIRFYVEPEKAPEAYQYQACLLNIAHAMQFTYAHTITLTDPPDSINEFALGQLGFKNHELPKLSSESAKLFEQAHAQLGI